LCILTLNHLDLIDNYYFLYLALCTLTPVIPVHIWALELAQA